MRLVLLIVAMLLVILGPLMIWGEFLDEQLMGDNGLRLLREWGWWAAIAGIGLIISDLILPVPALAIIAAFGMLYGPLVGGFLGGLGAFLAGLLAYGLCRLTGERSARWLLGDSSLIKLRRFFDRYGLWAVALSRWMPILPEALSCLAGLVRMSLGRFCLSLALGSWAMGFVFAAFGSVSVEHPVGALVLAAVLPLLFLPFLRRAFREDRTEAVKVTPASCTDSSDRPVPELPSSIAVGASCQP